VALEVLPACIRHQDDTAHRGSDAPLDEAPLEGLLPHGQARARRPPGLEHLAIRPPARADPLEEVEYQRFDDVSQLGASIHYEGTQEPGYFGQRQIPTLSPSGENHKPKHTAVPIGMMIQITVFLS
jgi:hypothetical protein